MYVCIQDYNRSSLLMQLCCFQTGKSLHPTLWRQPAQPLCICIWICRCALWCLNSFSHPTGDTCHPSFPASHGRCSHVRHSCLHSHLHIFCSALLCLFVISYSLASGAMLIPEELSTDPEIHLQREFHKAVALGLWLVKDLPVCI